MNDFAGKLENFWNVFMNAGGYREVLKGLQNTLTIAVLGLLIGVVIGTVIAAVRVLPKYKRLPRVLNSICGFYVGLFRGTPMVVQLLVFSEIMRSGILSVDSGQMEGGRSVGLSYGVTMLRIVIPQAVKNIRPTLGNEFIALIKETSVVSFVGATDLYVAFNNIGSNSYEFMVPYLVMAIIYIVLVMVISALVKLMERSLRKSDRSR